MEFASAAHVLGLLAMHLLGSRWKELTLPAQCVYSNCLQCIWHNAAGEKLILNAKYVLRLFAMRLPGNRWEEMTLPS